MVLSARPSLRRVEVPLQASVFVVDMEGLSDGRALKTILPQINPRKLVRAERRRKDLFGHRGDGPASIGEIFDRVARAVDDDLRLSRVRMHSPHLGLAVRETDFTFCSNCRSMITMWLTSRTAKPR
jgi:hypothetical protein